MASSYGGETMNIDIISLIIGVIIGIIITIVVSKILSKHIRNKLLTALAKDALSKPGLMDEILKDFRDTYNKHNK
jgi:small basic protein